MSKLFDQLKDAARSRDKSPGLLLEALEKSHGRDAATAPDDPVAPASGSAARAQAGAQSAEIGPRPSAAIAAAGATSADVPPAQAAAGETSAPSTSYAGIALAAAILAVAWLAWNAAPWRAPQKLKIDPATLKLDRSFQLDRPSAKGTSPPAPRS